MDSVCVCVFPLQPAPAWTTFRVGLYCGVFLVLIVTVAITGDADTHCGHKCSTVLHWVWLDLKFATFNHPLTKVSLPGK